MNRYLRMLPMLLVLLLGTQDAAQAGGGFNQGSKVDFDKKLTDAQVAECAESPEKILSMTRNRSKNVKGDAAARILDKIVDNEGVDSPKIGVVLGSLLEVSFSLLGSNMKESPNKDLILLIIQNRFGDTAANDFARTSGAEFRRPGAGGSDGGQESEGDSGDISTGEGDGTGQTQGQANTPPPPVQDDPEPPAEEPVPPPQPPVGQPYAGQQLL